MTIGAARKAAAAAKTLKDQGIDPIEARRREKEDNIAKSRTKPKLAFSEAAELFLEAIGGDWRHRFARSIWLNPLKAYAFPIIGPLDLDQIEVEHVVEVMKRAEDAGAVEQARRLRQRIEQVINFALGAGCAPPRGSTLRTASCILRGAKASVRIIAPSISMTRRRFFSGSRLRTTRRATLGCSWSRARRGPARR